MRVARSHSTPPKDYDTYYLVRPGTVVWEKENRRVFVSHLPNWLGRDTANAPLILAFTAIHGRTYVGTYLALKDAIGVLIP